MTIDVIENICCRGTGGMIHTAKGQARILKGKLAKIANVDSCKKGQKLNILNLEFNHTLCPHSHWKYENIRVRKHISISICFCSTYCQVNEAIFDIILILKRPNPLSNIWISTPTYHWENWIILVLRPFLAGCINHYISPSLHIKWLIGRTFTLNESAVLFLMLIFVFSYTVSLEKNIFP